MTNKQVDRKSIIDWFITIDILDGIDREEVEKNITFEDNRFHINYNWETADEEKVWEEFIWSTLDLGTKYGDDDHGTDNMESDKVIGNYVYYFTWQYSEHTGLELDYDAKSFKGVYAGTIDEYRENQKNAFINKKYPEYSRLLELCQFSVIEDKFRETIGMIWEEDNRMSVWKP